MRPVSDPRGSPSPQPAAADGTRHDDLVYDIGMFDAADTAFYLKKGFRVVAVEANPELCAAAATRFADAVDDGRLTIVNKAIATEPGTIEFFVNTDRPVWSSADPEWAARWAKQGFPSVPVEVEATTIADVVATHGVPYYLKIDIEGFDEICLAGLKNCPERPTFVSVESSAVRPETIPEQLDLFEAMGYRRFKIVLQHRVPAQQCPSPAREGRFVEHRFEHGATGLFGNELPGEWLSIDDVRRRYRTVAWQTRIVGPHTGLLRGVRNRYAKGVLRRIFPHGVGWRDTHATF